MGKRGNNEGSIYQQGSDGRWVGAVSLPSGDRRRFYGATRAEVARKLTAALKTQQDGLPLPMERETVGHFLAAWVRDTVRISVRPATFTSYVSIVRCHIVPELGGIPLTRLTPQDVQALMRRRLAEGLSPRRVDYIRGVLRRALNHAMRWGLVGRNVAALVSPPRGRPVEIEPFDPEEARRFLEVIRGDRLEALYTVALAVGLRQGEALGLRWQDVDLRSGTLAVRNSLQRINGVFRLVEPKTRRSRRTVHLPAVVVAQLHAHRARQLEERVRAAQLWEDHGLVFATDLGRPLHASSVTIRFQRVLERAGLRRQRFHDLRHACASLLLAQGVSPRVVMEVLGHSQVTLTLNTYSHVIPTLGREAADRMDEVLTAPAPPSSSRESAAVRLTNHQESNQLPPVALRVALLTETVPPFGDTIGPQNPVFDLGELVPAAGLEPATKGLRVPCSTN
jgi:integrase